MSSKRVSASKPGVRPLHTVPIAERKQARSWWRSILFVLAFDIGILCVNGTQFFCLPLSYLPWTWAIELHEWSIQYTKAAFGMLCVLMCQWFAPTTFVVTLEGMDDSVLLRDLRNPNKVVGLKLPPKLVMMANHQVYCDWWYLWAFTYFLKVHSSVVITLKKSLKWVPIVGWGMQMFRFIFLARSWVEDKVELGTQLTNVGKLAQEKDEPLTLFIFPEGTLVSKDTRPLSKKHADKMGIDDMTNMLLPRSTGLLFSLRTLAPLTPELNLLDVTIGYPGIAPAGYGQSWYTLRSVFMDGVAPPEVHLHLRMYNVERDCPIGDVTEKDGIARGAEATEEEKKAFDGWLLERWREKDRLLDGFYKEGKFHSSGKKPKQSTATKDKKEGIIGDGINLRIPVELDQGVEVLDAYASFTPVVGWYAIWRVVRFWV